MAIGQQFSSLEVVNQDLGKEVVSENGLEAADRELGKQVVSEGGMEAVGQRPESRQPRRIPEKIRPFRSRKRLWMIIIFLLSAMVLAAVLGGVLAPKKSHPSSCRFNSGLTGKCISTSTCADDGGKSEAGHCPGPVYIQCCTYSNTTSSSTSSPVPVPTPQSNPVQRNIAALAYPAGTSNVTRLYYQDSNGSLIEGVLDTSFKSWNFTSIGNIEKSNNALAAAVSRPGFPLTISIIYTDENFLIHDYNFNSTTKTWNAGSLSDQKLLTRPNSRLSVLYNQCSYCSNTTIVVYQDANDFVQAVNQTASGWIRGQVNVKAIAGTGLAMQSQYKGPRQGGTGAFNYSDQINLYYQQDAPALNISLASWKPAELNNGVAGWVTENQVYDQGFQGTPLAVAASNNNASGDPDWIQLLEVSNKGIGISTWSAGPSGAPGSWLEPQVYTPSAMSNSTANVRVYGDVAMTALGNAYAVVYSSGEPGNASVESWSMNADLTDWISTETVVKLND